MRTKSANLALGWATPMRKRELIHLNRALVPSLCHHNIFITNF